MNVFSRVRVYAQARTPSNSDLVFLLSQVSHKRWKWEEKLAKIQEKKGRKASFFQLSITNFEDINSQTVKTHSKESNKTLFHNNLHR